MLQCLKMAFLEIQNVTLWLIFQIQSHTQHKHTHTYIYFYPTEAILQGLLMGYI